MNLCTVLRLSQRYEVVKLQCGVMWWDGDGDYGVCAGRIRMRTYRIGGYLGCWEIVYKSREVLSTSVSECSKATAYFGQVICLGCIRLRQSVAQRHWPFVTRVEKRWSSAATKQTTLDSLMMRKTPCQPVMVGLCHIMHAIDILNIDMRNRRRKSSFVDRAECQHLTMRNAVSIELN